MNKREFIMQFVIARATNGPVGRSTVEAAETMWHAINAAFPEEKSEATYWGKRRHELNDDEVKNLEKYLDNGIAII